ncbi:MAG TPA: GNAT family protein [Armatimonadota bacterium]
MSDASGNDASPRPVLRSFVETDCFHVHRWFNNEEAVSRLVARREQFTVEDARAWVQRAMDDSSADRKWAIVPQAESDPIGFTALYGVSGDVAPEFAILIGDNACWGRGIGLAATQGTLRMAFDDFGAHRVSLTVLADNAGARSLYEKIGFREEGLLRAHVKRNGRLLDVAVYGLLRDEWARTRE